MSHRAFDELARLRALLTANEAEFRVTCKAGLVDFAKLADLRTAGERLRMQIAAKEETLRHDDD